MDVMDEVEADVRRRAEARYPTACAKIFADIQRTSSGGRFKLPGLQKILHQYVTVELSAEAVEQVRNAIASAFLEGRAYEAALGLGRSERQQSNGAYAGFAGDKKAKADLWRNAGTPIYMKERGQLLGAGAKASQQAVAQLIFEHCKKNNVKCPDAPTIVRWIIEMDKKQRAAVAQRAA